MENEGSFEINPQLITEIGVRIREEDPGHIWGDNEFRQKIFEILVDQHKLPWDEDIGAPDFNDPRVIRLYKAFEENLERDNNIVPIDGIEGRCEALNCGWKTEGQAKIEKTDRILVECDLTVKCRRHHEDSARLTHNRFVLYKDGNQVGIASVSTQVFTGYIEPLE